MVAVPYRLLCDNHFDKCSSDFRVFQNYFPWAPNTREMDVESKFLKTMELWFLGLKTFELMA